MTADTRQQRRKLERERRKFGERAIAKGVPARPQPIHMLGIAEVLKAKLLEASNPRRASEAAGLAHALAERSLRAFPGEVEIACKKGCNYCCHGFVGVLPAEGFRIADMVRASKVPSLETEAVRQRAAPLIGLSPEERIGRKLPCPLLVDGLCGVYPVRPLVCRQATSLSLPDCLDEFDGKDPDGRIEISPTHTAHSGNAHVALLGALRAVGLPWETYELGALLNVVLVVPDAEQRWLAGEPIFAGLKPVERNRQVDAVARGIAGEIAG